MQIADALFESQGLLMESFREYNGGAERKVYDSEILDELPYIIQKIDTFLLKLDTLPSDLLN